MEYDEFIEGLEALDLSESELRLLDKAKNYLDRGYNPPMSIHERLKKIYEDRESKVCGYLDKNGYCIERSRQKGINEKVFCPFYSKKLNPITCEDYFAGNRSQQ